MIELLIGFDVAIFVALIYLILNSSDMDNLLVNEIIEILKREKRMIKYIRSLDQKINDLNSQEK